jgi:diaminopimelate epimerase
MRGRVDAAAGVAVDLPGGRLQIRWSGPGEPVHMRGPAVFVFEGEFCE